jgi:hypothetical protein
MKPNDIKQQFVPHYECRFIRVIRWHLTEWRLHRFVGLAVPISCLVLGFYINRADIFARSGSFMCLIGGLMMVRQHLRGMNKPFFRDTGYADQPPFGKQNLPLEAKTLACDADSKAMRWGVWYVAIGTIVWGCGDLVLKWFRLCTY